MWKLAWITVSLLVFSLQAASAVPESGSGAPCNEIEVYTRSGCPHCDRAMLFLDEFKLRHPEITIHHYNLTTDRAARERLIALSQRHGLHRVAVPAFHVCDKLMVGFDTAASAGADLRHMLGLEAGDGPVDREGVFELPFLGTVSIHDMGLPLFTLAIGLVDGFNPCAMWVLLFLLALLVHVRSRSRIVLIAGTFVVVSGLVYFAFMAAWLNAFLIVGISRTLQLVLGGVALLIGAVHVKDFLAPSAGVSLSIPTSAKPGFYTRVRHVVQADNLGLAMAAVTALAVIVNLIELLCTAGLPALYTQILVSQNLRTGVYYGYLTLYNLAYVFDDALIMGIAVYTLNRQKLQEKQGRWLKLASGVVIIVLGLMLLLAPEHLVLAL